MIVVIELSESLCDANMEKWADRCLWLGIQWDKCW
jgi:hypothetical protein